MTHDKIKELVFLSIYDELTDEEKIKVDNHLAECTECKTAYEEQKKLFFIMASNKPKELDQIELVKARLALSDKLNQIKNNKSLIQKIAELFEDTFIGKHKFSLGMATTFIFGLLIGYSFLHSSTSPYQTNNYSLVGNSFINDPNFTIDNVSYINSNDETGEIELGFTAVKQINYKGNYNDVKTKKLIALALTNSDNDGVKIKSISTIATNVNNKFIDDDKIKNALIKTVKFDNNAGVRREALLTLQKFKYDDKIKNALLYVLSNDTNSGLRIEAINVLTEMKESGHKIDDKTKSVLTEQATKDENKFIRIKAASLLKEV